MLIAQVAFLPSFRKRAQLVVHSTFLSAVLIRGQMQAIASPPFEVIVPHQILTFNFGGDLMPENIVNILDSIAAVRGQEYVEGLVDMANILAPKAEENNQPG